MSGIAKRTRIQIQRKGASTDLAEGPEPPDTSSSEDEIKIHPRKRAKIYSSTTTSESETSEDEIIKNPKSNRNARFESSSSADSASSSSSDTDSSSNSSVGFVTSRRANCLHSSSSSDSKYDKKTGLLRPKIEKFSSSDNDCNIDKCPICLAKFRGQEVGCPDSCDHLFCVDCITEWGKNVNTCPVDRSQFAAVLVRAHAKTTYVTRSIPIRAGQPPPNPFPAALSPDIDNTTCEVCGSADSEETLLLCDGCDLGWHMECLTPPLEDVPEGEWYCAACARVVTEARRTVESLRSRLLPRTQQIERVRMRVINQINQANGRTANTSAQAIAGSSTSRTSTLNRRVGEARTLRGRRAVRQRREMTLRAVMRVFRTTKPKKRKRKYKRRKRRRNIKQTAVQKMRINYELNETTDHNFDINAKITAKIREERIERRARNYLHDVPTPHEKNELRHNRELAEYRRRKKLRKKYEQQSVKKRIAEQLRICQAQAWANLPLHGRQNGGTSMSNMASSSGSSRHGIIPPLHLFGQRDRLDYFSDNGNDFDGVASSSLKEIVAHSANNPGDLSGNNEASASTSRICKAANQPTDILGTILESQQQFHSRHSKLSLNSDGTLQVINNQPSTSMQHHCNVDQQYATASRYIKTESPVDSCDQQQLTYTDTCRLLTAESQSTSAFNINISIDRQPSDELIDSAPCQFNLSYPHYHGRSFSIINSLKSVASTITSRCAMLSQSGRETNEIMSVEISTTPGFDNNNNDNVDNDDVAQQPEGQQQELIDIVPRNSVSSEERQQQCQRERNLLDLQIRNDVSIAPVRIVMSAVISENDCDHEQHQKEQREARNGVVAEDLACSSGAIIAAAAAGGSGQKQGQGGGANGECAAYGSSDHVSTTSSAATDGVESGASGILSCAGGGGGDDGDRGGSGDGGGKSRGSDAYDPEEDLDDDDDDIDLDDSNRECGYIQPQPEQTADYSMQPQPGQRIVDTEMDIHPKYDQDDDDNDDIYSDIEATVSTSQRQLGDDNDNESDNETNKHKSELDNNKTLQQNAVTAVIINNKPTTSLTAYDIEDDEDDDGDENDLVIDDTVKQSQEEPALVSSSTNNNMMDDGAMDNMAATMERMEQHVKAMLSLVDDNDSIDKKQNGDEKGNGGVETPHSTCDDNKTASENQDDDDTDDDGCPNFNIYSSESVNIAAKLSENSLQEKQEVHEPSNAEDINLPNTQEEEEQLMCDQTENQIISTTNQLVKKKKTPSTSNLYSDSDEEIEIKIDRSADANVPGQIQLICDLRRMTEDISEEDEGSILVDQNQQQQPVVERSFTPCLDENNVVDKAVVVKPSCEDLEQISDEENRNDFSGHLLAELEINAKESELEFSNKTSDDYFERDDEPQQIIAKRNDDANPVLDEVKRGLEKNKDNQNTTSKIKGKEKSDKDNKDASFKKLSKSNKDRNYRNDKDVDNSGKKRIRDNSTKSRDRDSKRDRDKENRRDEKRRNKEKRKEIPRYSVRSLIADKPPVRKDRFGRDEEFRKTKSRSRSKDKSQSKRDKRRSSASISPLARERYRRDRTVSTPENQSQQSNQRQGATNNSNRRMSRSKARSSSVESTRSTNQQYIDRMIYDPPARFQLPQQEQLRRSRSLTPPTMAHVTQLLSHPSAVADVGETTSKSGKKRKGRDKGRSRESRSRSKKRRKSEHRVDGRLDGAGGKRAKRAGSRARRREQQDRSNKRQQRVRESNQQRESPPNYTYHHHAHSSTPHRVLHQPLTPPLNQSTTAANRGGCSGDFTPPPLRQLYEPRPSQSSRRHTPPPPLNNSTNISGGGSWTPPRIGSSQQQQAAAVESESLTVILTNDRNKRRERRRREKRGNRRGSGRRDRTPPPSKEVFASGDNILVSVSFNKDTQSTATPIGSQLTPMAQLASSMSAANKRKRSTINTTSPSAVQRQHRQRTIQQLSTVKPVAIIDLDRSPFRELTPSPRDIIVLSDDEDVLDRRMLTDQHQMDDMSATTDDDDDMEDGEVRNIRRSTNVALNSMCEHHQQVALQQQIQKNIKSCVPDGDLTSNLLHITTPSTGTSALSTSVNTSGPKTPPEPTCNSNSLNIIPSPNNTGIDNAAVAAIGGTPGTTVVGTSVIAGTTIGVSALGSQIKFSLGSLTKGAMATLRNTVNPLHDPDDDDDDDDNDDDKIDKDGNKQQQQQQENGATVSKSIAIVPAATSGSDKAISTESSIATLDEPTGAETTGGRGPNTPPNEPPTSAPSSPDVRHHRCPHNHDIEDNDTDDDDNDKDVYDPFDPTKSRSPSPELLELTTKDSLIETGEKTGTVITVVDPQRVESHTPPLVTATTTLIVTDIQPADSQTPATSASSIAGIATSTSSNTASSASVHRHHHHHHKTSTSTATSSTSGPHKIMAIIDLTPDDQDVDNISGRAAVRSSTLGVGPPLMTPAGKKMAAIAAAAQASQAVQIAQQQAAATSISSVLNQIVQVASTMFPSQNTTSVQQAKPTSTNVTSNNTQQSSSINLLTSVTSTNSSLAQNSLNYLPPSSLSHSTAILSSNTAGYSSIPQQVSTSSASLQQQINPPKINVLSSTILTAAALAAAGTVIPSTTAGIIGSAVGNSNLQTTSSLLSTVISNVVAATNANNSSLTSPMKSQQSKTINKPSPLLGGKNSKKIDIDAESPYSPGSSDYEDLFEPPTELPVTSHKNITSKVSTKTKGNSNLSVFDNLFGSLSPTNKYTSSKINKKAAVKKNVFGKTKMVGVKIDEDSLKVMDEVPNSAVEMQVKDKFLKKLNRQERVVEEVKMVLKPHYNKKHITKDEYKDVLRRAVPKICHNKSGEINPKKIQNLIEAYVKKLRQSKKVTSSSSKM